MAGKTNLAFLLAAMALLSANPARAEPGRFRLPLEDYPLDDRCLGWGGLNRNFPRCGRAGKHVADDACAPNGTQVLAVADGSVRFAAQVGECFDNWGWVTVVEHVLPDGSRVCSVYGHCAPLAGVTLGAAVTVGQPIAAIDNVCLPHIHFGIYLGAFGAARGTYPPWLLGYLPDDSICLEYLTPWPGSWVDPVQFVLDRVAVQPTSWAALKRLYH